MHVVLVGPEIEENLSLRYLAAALRQAGHWASLARFDSPEHVDRVVEQVLRERPDLVGLSMVYQARATEFYELARALRRAEYGGHVTAGGHFATCAYETVLRELTELDSVARQEGEETIVELVAALERGAGPQELALIAGMVVRGPEGSPLVAPPRRQADDLDVLAFPARDTPPDLHLGVPTAHLVGSRGCYAACDYCCIRSWHAAGLGKRYRMRSVENVAEEMAALYHERGVRNFVFHDDNFFLPTVAGNRARFEGLRAAIRKHRLEGIGLVLKLRPNDCDRENLLILKDIGLFRVFVGIENASQRQLKSLGRDVEPERLASCTDLLRDLDVYFAYNVMLFDAYTTLDDVATNTRFLRDRPHYPFNWSRVEVYAGTELEKRYGQEGRLRGDRLARGYDMGDPRAHLMFELLLPAVYRWNFDCDGLANMNIGLGYHHQLLRHFHPGVPSSADLSSEVRGTIEAVSAGALDLLERTHAFARAVDLDDHSAISRFGEQLHGDSLDAQEVLRRRMGAALCRIDGLADIVRDAPVGPMLDAGVTSRLATPRLVPRRGLMAAIGAGLMWVLSGCGQHSPPPDPDPVPDPPGPDPDPVTDPPEPPRPDPWCPHPPCPPVPDPPPSAMDRPRPSDGRPLSVRWPAPPKDS